MTKGSAETKWTKGPWRIDPDDRPGMHWNNHIVSEPNPNLTICLMTHDGTPENETGEANAKLVAASPSMYMALKWGLQWIHKDTPQAVVAQMEEAIRLAEEGQ